MSDLYEILKKKLTSNERLCLSFMILSTASLPLAVLSGLISVMSVYDSINSIKVGNFNVLFSWPIPMFIISLIMLSFSMSAFVKHEDRAVKEFDEK